MESKAKLCIFICAVLCPALASAVARPNPRGIVTDIEKCGGLGTFVQLRISECEGRCRFVPGTVYNVEADYFPSRSIDSLSLAVDLVFQGIPVRILDLLIPNSSVQPGFLYTVRFNIVPNDILAGQAAKFRATLFRTDDVVSQIEVCLETEVDIAAVFN